MCLRHKLSTTDINSELTYYKPSEQPNNFAFWFYVCRIARLKGWNAALEMIGDRPVPKAIADWKEQNNIV